ncbi:hypothetical protein QQF64_003863 [Cirrhinus molitorella]|uniref:Transferrin n=1 Tax=Cirrhinus molitorella TaxID=172907 RepID=A0ABR3MMJ5_9TELE
MAFVCLFFFLADVNSFARSSCFEDHLSKQKGAFCQGDGGRIDCVVTATGKDEMEHALVLRLIGEPWLDD